MSIEKPKKQHKFLKAVGKIGAKIAEELVYAVGRKFIGNIVGKIRFTKKPPTLILFLALSTAAFANVDSIPYPITGNKQRLGWQTTGNGLVYRGRSQDTITKPSNYANKDIKAYMLLDTVNNALYNYIASKGGWLLNTDTTILTVDTTSLSHRINLKLNISDTTSMLSPYFRDADTSSLNLTSRFAAKVNIADTAAMLTNYLLTGTAASTYLPLTGGSISGSLGVIGGITGGSIIRLGGTSSQFLKADGTTDSNTYLTTSSASSIYLPLTGGTVSGTINRQEGNHDGSSSTFYYNILNYFARRDNVKGNQTAQITFTDRPGTSTFANNVRTSDIYLMTAKNLSGGELGQYLDTTLSVVANQDGGRIGISKLNPGYKLDVNGTFNASGNSLIGGTLGVTGAATLSSTLAVTGATSLYNTLGVTYSATFGGGAVINDNSNDEDTRIESDGNANMVFVDASADRVGIGTSSPSKTLDVNGELKIATTSATPTSLLGKDGSNVVGEVTTVTQTGLMKAGSTTANTSSVGIITVAHGLSYTPSQVIATVAQQNSYVIVCHAKDATNMSFTVYDSVTGNALDTVSVGFFWLAIK